MRRLAVLVCCLALAACGDDAPDPPDTSPDGVEQITGNERIGWQQRAATSGELSALRFNIYVDQSPSEIQGVNCSDEPTAAGFSCSGQLPPLSPGRHVLQITSFDVASRLESSRSASLIVQVGQSSLSPPVSAPIKVVTSDGLQLVATPLTSDLDDPTDLAIAPDGRMFITERAGRIRVVRGGTLQPTPALVLDDVVASDRRGLLGLAIDPAFEKTGHVFAVYTAATGFRVARFRAVGDTLGDRAIVIDDIDAPRPSPAATVRFGPDGKLYLAVDDAGDPSKPGDLGSFSGKVLRLNADGTTPPDQPGNTPVYALHINEPRGMAWDDRRLLWIAEGVRLQGVSPPVATTRATNLVNYNLPPDVGPGGLMFYRGALMPPLAGHLLLASTAGQAILRLKFDPDDGRRIASSEYLLRGAVGGIRSIAAGTDGLVFFCTDRELFMLAPDPAPREPLRQ